MLGKNDFRDLGYKGIRGSEDSSNKMRSIIESNVGEKSESSSDN